jgi:hypothetical protein
MHALDSVHRKTKRLPRGTHAVASREATSRSGRASENGCVPSAEGQTALMKVEAAAPVLLCYQLVARKGRCDGQGRYEIVDPDAILAQNFGPLAG